MSTVANGPAAPVMPAVADQDIKAAQRRFCTIDQAGEGGIIRYIASDARHAERRGNAVRVFSVLA